MPEWIKQDQIKLALTLILLETSLYNFANSEDPNQRYTLFVLYEFKVEFTPIIHIDMPYFKIGTVQFLNSVLKTPLKAHTQQCQKISLLRAFCLLSFCIK